MIFKSFKELHKRWFKHVSKSKHEVMNTMSKKELERAMRDNRCVGYHYANEDA